ncbi:DUF4129 domain-containing protein [Paenibacillus sp. 1P07SE]|uniref:DUF4129 domain-containing protein n=1 Tax=Paenibacillus sp. 1P07SE TaxID=3132209 RepID=UPI0039A5FCA2
MKERVLAKAGLTTLQGIVETLLFYPLILLFAVYLLPQPQVWLWSAGLPLLFGAGHAAYVWLKLDKVYKLLAIALLVAAAWSVIWFGSSWLAAVSLLFAILAFIRGARGAEQEWEARFPMSAMFAGMILHFILSVATVFRSELHAYLWLIGVCGLLALAATLYCLNAEAVRQQTLSGQRKSAVPGSVSGLNRLLVLVLLLAAVAITMLRTIQEAFEWLRGRIVALLQLLPSREGDAPVEQPTAPEMPEPPMLGEEPSEPSALMQWLEQAAMIAVYVLLGLLVLYGCYALGKRLPGWLRRLYQALTAWINRGERQGEELGYVDTVESLIQTRDSGPGLGGRLRDRLSAWNRRKPRWSDDMTNEERVRFLYRRWLQSARKEGYELKPHLTPLETVADIERWRSRSSREDLPLTRLYEQARYGSHPVKDSQVQELKHMMEQYLS